MLVTNSFTKLVSNDIRYFALQPLFWLACVLVPAIGYLFTVGLTAEAPSFAVQLQFKYMALVMLILPIFMGVLLPVMFARDSIYEMAEIIATTRFDIKTQNLSRLVAFTGLTLLLFSVTFALVAIVANDSLSFVSLATDLLFFIVFILAPTIIGFATIGLWMSRVNASTFAYYAMALVVFVGYMILASLTANPILAGSALSSEALYSIALWLDPYGFTAFIKQTKHAEQSQFWFNRALVCLIIVGLFLAYWRTANTSLAGKHKGQVNTQMKTKVQTAIQTKTQIGVTSFTSVSPNLEILRALLKVVITNKINLLILLVWPMIIFSEVLSGLHYVEPFAIKNATSLDAINRINSDVLPVFGSLLVALWSWQLTGAFRTVKVHELIATTPILSRHLVFMHMAAIIVMVIVLCVITIVGCVAAEAAGSSEIQLGYYLVEFSLTALSLSLLGVLFVALQMSIKQRAISSAMVLILLIFKFTPISGALGLTHTLWNIAGSPLQPADHFWGYVGSGSVYVPYTLVWFFIIAVVVWLACKVTHRGTFYQTVPLRLITGRPAGLSLAVLAICAVVTLDQQITAEKPLTFTADREQWKADYEREFKHWLAKPQPRVKHVDAQINLQPNQQRADFTLNFTLVNDTTQPIQQILIGRYGNFDLPELKVLSQAMTLQRFEQSKQTVVKLSQPIQPGDTLKLEAGFSFEQPKLWPVTSQFFVKPEMSYLRGIPLLPVIGFQPEWMLRDKDLRAQLGLEPMPQLAPSERFGNRPFLLAWQRPLDYQWQTFSSRVTVPSSYMAVAPGELTKVEEVDDTRIYHYQTQSAMRAVPSWFAVPLKQNKTVNNDNIKGWRVYEQKVELTTRVIQTQIFVPQTGNESDHQVAESVAINQLAMADTLRWLSNNISPYRHNSLRLFAAPGQGPTGYALPQSMLIGYDVGFLAKTEPGAGFDQRYRRAVHETAHQWFGHDIGNGISEDGAFLVESLAKYVELVMLEQRFGKAAKDALVQYETGRFNNAHNFYYGESRALVDATSPHQQYSQASLAFSKLRDELGDEVIIQALKELWRQHGFPKAPATSMDFVRILTRVAGQQHQELIAQMLLKAPE